MSIRREVAIMSNINTGKPGSKSPPMVVSQVFFDDVAKRRGDMGPLKRERGQ
jgi:hypothetical protein